MFLACVAEAHELELTGLQMYHFLSQYALERDIRPGSIAQFRYSLDSFAEFLGHTTPRVAWQSYLDPLQLKNEAIQPPKLPKTW